MGTYTSELTFGPWSSGMEVPTGGVPYRTMGPQASNEWASGGGNTVALTSSVANAAAKPNQEIGSLLGIPVGATVTLTDSAGGVFALNGYTLSFAPAATIPSAPAVLNPVITINGVAKIAPISVGIASNVTDDFSGTNGTALIGKSTTTGSKTWAGSGGAFTLNGSGRVVAPTAAGVATFVPTQTSYMLSATLRSYSSSNSICSLAALIFKYQNATNYFYVRHESRSQMVTVNKVVANVDKELGAIGLSTGSGVDVDIAIRVNGDEFTVYVNGVEEATFYDTQFSGVNGVGIQTGFAGSPPGQAQYANFQVAPLMGTRFNWPKFTEVNNATPVLPRGTGAQWDATDANNPNVIWDPVGSRYMLNYSGYYNGGTPPGTNVQHAGLAYSSSLDGPWTKDASNPVFSSIAEDNIYAMNGGLIWSPSRSLFLMPYVSRDAGGTINCIRLATSPTGAAGTWTRQGIIWQKNATWNNGGIFDPCIRRLADGRLELWACGATAATYLDRKYGRMFSSDEGLNWTEDANNPVMNPGAQAGGLAHAIYYQDLGEPFPWSPIGGDANHTLLAYDGVNMLAGVTAGYVGYQDIRAIQFAATLDNGKTWHRFMTAYTAAGSGFMSKQVFDSCIVDAGTGTLRLFHSSSDIAGAALNVNIQIGMATATTPTTLYA